jgi:hypothetical protein
VHRPHNQNKEHSMKLTAVLAGVFMAILIGPLSARAQGVPGGAAHGFHTGNRIAGPVGAVVGTAVGGVVGGIEGALGVNHQYGIYADAPPRSYRHRKVYRSKTKHSRRARATPNAGGVEESRAA